MSWTDERVEILTKMWAEGNSASQIAKELGVLHETQLLERSTAGFVQQGDNHYLK